jgi:hypothetical protein
MALPPVIGMDGDRVDEVPDGRFAPIRTPIGSAPEKRPCSCCTNLQVADRPLERGRPSRRLVGKVRAQHGFSASTSSPSSRSGRTCMTLKAASMPGARVSGRWTSFEVLAGRVRLVDSRDHLGHHLLAELDAVLDERQVDPLAAGAARRASSSTRSCVLLRMKPAGTRRIALAASLVHSNVEINGFFVVRAISRARRRSRRCRPRLRLRAARAAARRRALDVERRAVSSSITCRRSRA